MDSATPYQQVQNLNKNLEYQVKERTAQLHEQMHQLNMRTAELAASKAQMQTVLDHTPAFIHIIGLDGRIKFANAKWRELPNQVGGNFVGCHINEVFTSQEAEMFFQQNQTVAAARQVVTFESEIVLADGVHTFLDVKVPLIEPTGDVNSIYGIALDLTERKRAEESLQQSEERFRSLCACSPVGIFITDTKGYCTYTNPRLQAIADFTFEETLAKRWVQSVHPDDRERVFDDWSAHAQDAKQYSDEFRLQTRAGVVRWVHVRSSPMLCDNGKLIGYVGTVEDVTERKQDEERLRALTHQLQQRWQQLQEISRLKSEFLANMSHELRTPLTAVLGFSSILLQQHFGTINPKQEQYLSHIHTSGEHLLGLINALLDLAQIEADKLELNFETVDLAQLCQEALQMIEVRALEKHQHLSLKLPVVCSEIVVDRQRVLQILLNYLDNAVKFTPEGGVIVLSTRLSSDLEWENLQQFVDESFLSVRPDAHFLVLSVTDTGIGVPLERQHLLFQTFQQVDGAIDRKYEGTGLGLTLTRRLAELHGGGVSFTSIPGTGSTFSAWIPLYF